MADRLRCAVSYERAHDAIEELLCILDNPELRQAAGEFGRKLVDQGLREKAMAWQSLGATEILMFLTDGRCNFSLECEERRRHVAREVNDGSTTR